MRRRGPHLVFLPAKATNLNPTSEEVIAKKVHLLFAGATASSFLGLASICSFLEENERRILDHRLGQKEV